MFLKLSGLIEGQLRDAYAKKYEAGFLNQSSLAQKLGINRSAVHHRLTGRTNMTIETIADMLWGLDHDIELKIFDPAASPKNQSITTHAPHLPGPPLASAAETTLMKIASSTPTSNTGISHVLGRTPKGPVTPQAPLDYGAQLVGTK